jgi:hypothetical protein
MLIKLAWARSGDKGNLFNVAVIARRPEFLPYIDASLTDEVVAAHYAHLLSDSVPARIDRFYAPGMNAINFVVNRSMAGGMMASPRLDPAAKGMAQLLLCAPISVPRRIADIAEAQSPAIDGAPFKGIA